MSGTGTAVCPLEINKEQSHEHESHPRVAHPRFVLDRHGVPGGHHRLDSAPYQSPAYSNWNDDDAYRAPIAQPVARPIYWRTGWHGQPMPAVYRPVTLAAGLRLPANSQTEIKVGGQQGAFTTLKLEATGGRSFIRQVYIMFENGQEQILRNVNRTLTGNDCFTIDLDGGRRQINRVIVYGALGQPGWRRAPGTFNLT